MRKTESCRKCRRKGIVWTWDAGKARIMLIKKYFVGFDVGKENPYGSELPVS